MSAQTMAEVFAPVQAIHRARILADTWGHLAPKKNRTYRGYVVFALGCFGSDSLNPTVLECELEGGVYRWEGAFRNYKFAGSVRRLALE